MKFKLRRYYLYYLGRTAAFLFQLLPIRAGVWIGARLGALAYYLVPKYRRIAIENLTAVFGGEMTPPQIAALARRAFENQGRNAAELVNFPKIHPGNVDRFISSRNMEIVDRAFARGKGTIILTAHFGNWEYLSAYLRIKGYPGVAIGKRIYFKRYDRFLNDLRKIHDVNIIPRDGSAKAMLKVLKDNRILGILADQDVDSVEGVFVDFFGRKAFTPVGPAALAALTGAALVPTFIIRDGARHIFTVEEPIELADTGDRKADLVINTQKWSDVVESYIRRYPDQWVWMHRRWKTRPDAS